MGLIDTHCHLNFDPLVSNIDDVLLRARRKGVERVVVPAYDTASWSTVESLAQLPDIFPALGVHPWAADESVSLDVLAERLTRIRAVAVGEIGLDFKVDVSRERQIALFEGQMRVAAALDLPVLLHVRGAFEEMLSIIERLTPRPAGVIHAFSRGPELAERFLAAGFHIAFGGAVTRKRADRARRAAKRIPLEKILLETDAPSIGLDGVAPVDVEPAHTADVAAALAELRGVTVETIAEATTENANRLFKFDAC